MRQIKFWVQTQVSPLTSVKNITEQKATASWANFFSTTIIHFSALIISFKLQTANCSLQIHFSALDFLSHQTPTGGHEARTRHSLNHLICSLVVLFSHCNKFFFFFSRATDRPSLDLLKSWFLSLPLFVFSMIIRFSFFIYIYDLCAWNGSAF